MGNEERLPQLRLRPGSLATVLLTLGLLGGVAIAQPAADPTADPAEMPGRPPNPLELTAPDPLLYIPPVDRPMTAFERWRLRRNADGLDTEAQAEYDAGNIDAAFAIWYRSLRLRRALGLAEEIPALGRIGALAWETGGQKFAIQVIGDRLIDIGNALPAEPERPLQLSLAEAYEQLRLSERAVVLYEELLPDIPAAEREFVLLKIGQLHRTRFNYPPAIAAYEELLDLSEARGDFATRTLYLRELADLYALADRPEASIATKERLLAQYADDPTAADRIPALLVEIGNGYATLDRADAASAIYQDAYLQAWDLEQFATASEALNRLGALYERFEQGDRAIRAYSALTQVQQRSRDLFGEMQTHDRLGELYLAQNDPTQALAAFERALSIAETLGYEPERFAEKVEQSRDRLPPTEPEPQP